MAPYFKSETSAHTLLSLAAEIAEIKVYLGIGMRDHQKPICPECGDAPHETRYENLRGMTLLDHQFMPCDQFWDVAGRWHDHDYSLVSDLRFECNNGHKWRVSQPQHGCECGWPESGPYADKRLARARKKEGR
jgi:hypothetical protein